MGQNQINIALLGLGRIGQMHALNLINHPEFNLKYYREFADSLKNKSKKRYFYPNEDEGLETAKFINACKVSSKNKRWCFTILKKF